MKRADFDTESVVRQARAVAMKAARKKPHVTKRPAAKQAAKQPTHPPAQPDALIEFMMHSWRARGGKKPARHPNAAAFKARRRKLSRAFPGVTLVIPTGHEKIRANDTNYRFRPGSDFFYLTGNLEPDCVLVLEPKRGGGHKDILWVEPNPGRSDTTFFTDHHKGELWVGPRLGIAESKARFGVHESRGLPELPAYLGALAKRRSRKVRVLRGFSESVEKVSRRVRKRAQVKDDLELASVLSELRLVKDPLEIRELSAVVASTKRAFEDVILSLRSAESEREIEGVFNLRARKEGNDTGYGTIAATGANACTLHWTRNDARLDKKQMLLLDAGVEGRALYTADITRTVPLSGRFSPAQREVYELVWRAHDAALAAVRPGADFMEPNDRAQRVLAEGLQTMGILASAADALKPDQQLQKRYTLHNVSHMLGIDVHDCAKARQEVYRYGKLRAGMVLTVEPGLYFQPDDLTVPKKYRGIGVRIEDDVLVTRSGMRNLSLAIPRQADDVERWMASVWKTRKPKLV